MPKLIMKFGNKILKEALVGQRGNQHWPVAALRT